MTPAQEESAEVGGALNGTYSARLPKTIIEKTAAAVGHLYDQRDRR